MSKPQRDETTPSWLNDSFIENVVRKKFEKNDLKILEREIKLATAVGDHYGSLMFRIILTLQKEKDDLKENFSFIVKCIPSGIMGEELRKLAIFDREEEAYTNALPAINELLKQAYPDHEKLSADCYLAQKAPDNALVFEDLKESGFVIGSRMKGLDMDHTLLVLKSLARFHAASIVVRKRNPESLKIFETNFWTPENAETIKNILTTPFNVIPTDMEDWEDFDGKEGYIKRLKKVGENVLDRAFEIWKPNDSKMNVLLHGDAWVNNFMFKYDSEGKVSGINFVDFQIMNINSPAMELQYFIFTSTAPSIKFDQIDFFLKTYHETFEDTLNRLGHKLDKPYSLDDLKRDFEEKNFWGFTVLCSIFPLFMVPKEDVCHPDEFFKPDESSGFKNMYKTTAMKEVLKRGLKYFDERGVF